MKLIIYSVLNKDELFPLSHKNNVAFFKNLLPMRSRKGNITFFFHQNFQIPKYNENFAL